MALTWTLRRASCPLPPAKVLGVDPSLTSLGLSLATEDGFRTARLQPKLMGVQRLAWFKQELSPVIPTAALVVVEGYSFGSRDSHAHALGELGGLIRMIAYEENVPFLVVPPQTLKKFVTGAGNCDKGGVMKDLFKRWGVDVEQNDEADACALALFGLYHSGRGIALPLLTAKQREALVAGGELTPARIAVRSRVRPAA